MAGRCLGLVKTKKMFSFYLKNKLKKIFILNKIFLNYFSNPFCILKFKYDYISISSSKDLLLLLIFLKLNIFFRFESLLDIYATDFPFRSKNNRRFELNYYLISFVYNIRLTLKNTCPELSFVPTCTHIYLSAGWLERECWDMFGIFFYGNPDLRRILTDYGFEGFPLRKDFPLTGFFEVRYSDSEKKIVYDKVELNQQYRKYSFNDIWLNF